MYRYHNTNLYITSGDCYSDQTISGSIQQLSRVQSIAIGIESPRTNIQSTNLEGKTIQLDKSYVNFNTDYYFTDGKNESLLGFITSGNENAVKNLGQEKNFYGVFLEDGLEPNLYTGLDYSKYNIVSVGNVLLNSYTLDVQAGGVAAANCEFQGLNLLVQTGVPSGKQIPTININTFNSSTGTYNLPAGNSFSSGIIMLGGKDIVMNLPTGSLFGSNASGDNSVILQGFTFNVSINRNTIKEMGKVIKERKIVFPIEFTLNAKTIIDRYKTDNLNKVICDNISHNFDILFKQPCSESGVFKLSLKNMVLESQGISESITQYVQADLQWKGYMFNFGTGSSYFTFTKYL